MELTQMAYDISRHDRLIYTIGLSMGRYEAILERHRAQRTRNTFEERGYIDGVARIVMNWKAGLEALAKHGLLAHCFEQIIVDFPDIYCDPALQAKARANLDRVRELLCAVA
jgi:hypothetical protein